MIFDNLDDIRRDDEISKIDNLNKINQNNEDLDKKLDINRYNKVNDNDGFVPKNLDNSESYDMLSATVTKCGFILSYGESDGLMPVGTFVVSGFEDAKGNSITEEKAMIDGYIVFRKIELNDDYGYHFVINGPKVVIPYMEFLEEYKKIESNNKQLTYSDLRPETIEWITRLLGDKLSRIPEDEEIEEIEGLGLQGTSLSEVGAEYTNANGVEMGTNYRIFPFETQLLLQAVLTRVTSGRKDDPSRNKVKQMYRFLDEDFENNRKQKDPEPKPGFLPDPLPDLGPGILPDPLPDLGPWIDYSSKSDSYGYEKLYPEAELEEQPKRTMDR